MAKLNPVVLALISVIFSGCASVKMPFFGNKPDPAETVTASDEKLLVANEFVDKGRVVNRARLQQRQNVLIFPFHAGVGVEATDNLDKIALMIIKGITDTFDSDQTGKHDHFHILTAESQEPAELILKGRFTEVAGPSTLKKWLPLTGRWSLGVSGKLMDAKSGEVLVIFTDKEATDDKNDDTMKLGYQIGINIGQFLLSGVD
ncbi:MAG: hypothetical protein A3C36_02130 [Omnitrophica WOR_2 bacterium RIFCSPHIGHO2_02_FULL_52_10]|nr:MAG: hypothetical protein A3C36_02130 [Omnitrophica WOR_2 bacterium RIFCSPHIGHO2_02_FULL_52_10]